MSEIAVTVVKVLFLALLWLFILSAVSVVRSDLFGRTVTADDGPPELESPKPPARKLRRQRGAPRALTITQGPQTGDSGTFVDHVVLVGRGSDCQIVLDDDYVSTRHARVVDGPEGVYVEDLGSTNGTYVNNQRITNPTAIGFADVVRIGRTIMRLEP
ncbi:FHA domain-containing protein FhaB/FipA [Microlunatus antarcticus]